ncbi:MULTISPECIES: sigma-54-dependent Fis family transcriptional regulator [unclassified Bacillus (in: firmicutes)]|uniref:sigma-54 interaction domain-containing protein n=1 Tax=unclassified Bacillus (in: firmicutes) TaxID=185979 RepID=UPI001BED11C7|nr:MULTISPECIES: sigma 54-interacting transcriptional regulator [unclassified Bacillus (in: firmicutes)]MBT2618887.1 sigma 54-interacting transcriptional regulator [Bacillus sp. ISL-78]MBT2627863.1 sigma 54-interacting transcriptional regulator [Bacillus sp. ISL-101]
MGTKFFEDKHFHHIFNHLKDGIFIADSKGVALWVNDTSTKQMGAPRSKIIGRSVIDLEKAGLFNPSITIDVLERKESVTKVQTSKGRQYLATGYLVRIQEDNTEYILVQVKDITETVKDSFKLEKAEALLQKYWDELQQMKLNHNEGGKKQLVIGNSKKHKEMFELIGSVASVDVTVLLHGETGVGKSMVAEEIHKKGYRSDKPFVQINCSAIPEALLESELFGYKKGAFTGANSGGKIGLVEKAKGGTLFLDEIGELPLNLQPKLLQLLQNKSFIPIGSTDLKEVDIRIITATNQDLLQMVHEKRFREDLYYRLNVVAIQIPALRERKEDILPLIFNYFDLFKAKYKKTSTLSNELLDSLQNYSWPGNIRELENMMERLVVTAKSNVIEKTALSNKVLEEIQHKESSNISLNGQSLPTYLEQVEQRAIMEAKKEHKSTRKAAQSLGITQSSFMRRLKKYNL